MSTDTIRGLHHVTAICSDAQGNPNFYTGILGLRLVKVTVNFDDPASYHYYYGDALGRPGSILTFFVWPGAGRGRHGSGSVVRTAFGVPPGALGWWKIQLDGHGVAWTEGASGAGAAGLRFEDPDGLVLELVEAATPGEVEPWNGAPVPAEVGIRGIHSVTLGVRTPPKTAAVLTGAMGYRELEALESERAGGVTVATGILGERPGQIVQIETAAGLPPAGVGAGVVHHVAFRAETDAAQVRYREDLLGRGFHVSPVMDRVYFHSIYFREPSGVLFELATDPPGFSLDEPEARLGTSLRLPPWLEKDRAQIEGSLPRINVAQPHSPPHWIP